jgi:hypothetical protein
LPGFVIKDHLFCHIRILILETESYVGKIFAITVVRAKERTQGEMAVWNGVPGGRANCGPNAYRY